MSIPFGLSTSSLFPDGIAATFSMAADLGFDGVEIMVTHLVDSREKARLVKLSERFDMPILSIHAPTLFWTQQVWGSAWQKMDRSAQLAEDIGARSVVAHPPFRWQKKYAAEFHDVVSRLEAKHGLEVCVENMYPWRVGGREVEMYLPHWDPIPRLYKNVTWDYSHAALAGVDSLEAFKQLGSRLKHIHVTDGHNKGTADDHLRPGYGDQKVAESLAWAGANGFDGQIVLEISTRKAKGPGERERWLAESLEFTKKHFFGPTAETVSEAPEAEGKQP